ncbi:MAG: general secretion pathway protein GspM [Comamonadaceae bacterium CG_4_9_14_3_um_filter_60_33]|nr:MAG: general secretion pathway protein GspM [Comamonadaceae bacterium CG2_30_59_20]PIY30115.1 MAG: general secretion pathway protein GspM [Comamonadaceae bacterium CG_4_10_14_3_um_filter_60_42]PJB46604.1 MAG: general secretion pathway protein GspM [Comamonadaceae bacterium CG_4_9_14_3_um_filter_60_33]
MTLLKTLQTRWHSVSPREQRLVVLGGVFVSLALLWWLALAPALAVLKAAPAQHRALDAQLQHMLRLQAQAKALQAQPVLSPDQARRALDAALLPLGGSAQMNVQIDRATVTLKAVSASALAQWLATVRQNAHTAPTEARLVHNAAGSWDGTLVLNLGARP